MEEIVDKKQKLLEHYIDYLYGKIKEHLPMIADDINISILKEYLVDGENIHKSKQAIEEIFHSIIQEYINTKHNLVMHNSTYLLNRYGLFSKEYQFAYTFLKETNFTYQIVDYEIPALADNITIDDCRRIVYEFYKELFNNDKEMLEKIYDIIYNKITIHYETFRSITNHGNIQLQYSNDLLFLITLVHEVAHKIGYNYSTLFSNIDLRSLEIPPYFTERLFIDYLINGKERILKDKNGNRPLSKKDKDIYNIYIYNLLFKVTTRIFYEYNFVSTLSKYGEFDMKSYNQLKFINQSPNIFFDYIVANNILNMYLPEEYRYLDIGTMEKISSTNEIFSTSELESFEGDIRYITCMLMAYFFDKTKNNRLVKENYKEYLKNSTIYNIYDTYNIFELEEDDIQCVITAFMEKYKKIIKKLGYELKSEPYFTKEDIKKDIEKFKKIRDNSMEKSDLGVIKNIFCQMANIVGLDDFDADIYLYEPSLQLEDFEVEKYNKLKEKLYRFSLNKYL